jgi:hypothetical protein
MQWLLPLMALLAFAAGSAMLSRNQTPSNPLRTEVAQHAPQVQPEQEPNRSVQDQQNAQNLQRDLEPTPPITTGGASANDTADHTGHGGEEGTEFWPPFMGLRLKVTDTLLVLFTLALAGFTYRLWKSTDKLWQSAENQLAEFRRSLNHSETVATQQSADMRASIAEASRAAAAMEDNAWQTRIAAGATTRTAERQLRAYVFPRAPKIIGLFSDSPPLMTCRIRNFGQTPAYELRISATVFVGIEPLREMPAPEPIEQITDFVLGPSGECNISRSYILSDQHANEIRAGRMAIYFRGIISYRDAFGHTPPRTTEFTLMKSRQVGLEDEMLAVRAEGGNGAT